jgi:hypothetical protein
MRWSLSLITLAIFSSDGLLHETSAVPAICSDTDTPTPSHICPHQATYSESGCYVDSNVVKDYCAFADPNLMFENCFPDDDIGETCCLAPGPVGMIQVVKEKAQKPPSDGHPNYGYAELQFNFVTVGANQPGFEIAVDGKTLQLRIDDSAALHATTCDGNGMRIGSFDLWIPLIPTDGKDSFDIGISTIANSGVAPSWQGTVTILADSTIEKPKFNLQPAIKKNEDNPFRKGDTDRPVFIYAPGPPTRMPSRAPSTLGPTRLILIPIPNLIPTRLPTQPTSFPTSLPTSLPTSTPTISGSSTGAPTTEGTTHTTSPTNSPTTASVVGESGGWVVPVAAGAGALFVALSFGGVMYRKRSLEQSEKKERGHSVNQVWKKMFYIVFCLTQYREV